MAPSTPPHVALDLTDAMLAAAAQDDWRTCIELAQQRAAGLAALVAAGDVAGMSRLLDRNGALLSCVARQRTRAHEDLLALRRGSAARDRYRHAGGDYDQGP